jgi:hypothetical protein
MQDGKSTGRLRQEAAVAEPEGLDEVPVSTEKWRCHVCGRWRYTSWWAVYQHFRKAHPWMPVEQIPLNCSRIA